LFFETWTVLIFKKVLPVWRLILRSKAAARPRSIYPRSLRAKKLKGEKQKVKKSLFTVLAVVSLLGVMVSPMQVLAGTGTDSSNVSGTMETYYTLDVPASFSLGSISKTASATSSAQTITVTTNDASSPNVTIAVRGEDGQLENPSAKISPALQINSGGLGWTNQAISSSNVSGSNSLTIVEGTASATFTLTQPIITNAGLIPAGTYSETLTFTATFGS
jgi:VCBS repeat-containing protein